MTELTEQEKAAAAAIKARHDQYVHSQEFKEEAKQEAKRLADAARKIEASQPPEEDVDRAIRELQKCQRDIEEIHRLMQIGDASEQDLQDAHRRRADADRATQDAYAEAARERAENRCRLPSLWARIREWLGKQRSE